MGSAMPEYDPRVIERHASKLYAKASAVVAGSAAVGGFVGAAFGAVPLTSLGDAWPVPSAFGFATLLFGGVAGALVGYVIGDARSFGYRLQAQSALCQIQLERHMAQTALALEALAPQARRAAASVSPAAAPVEPPTLVAPPPAATPPRLTMPDEPKQDEEPALPPVSPRYGAGS